MAWCRIAIFLMVDNDTSMRGPTTFSLLAKLSLHQVDVEPLSSKAYVVIISPLPLPLTLTGTIGKALYSWLPPAIETLLPITTWALWGCVRFGLDPTLGPCLRFSSCLLRKLASKASWSEPRCFREIEHWSTLHAHGLLQPEAKCV